LGETEKVIDVVKESMESAAEIKVPLVVDIGTGNNWDQAH
jgi:DNA polymerase-1